MIVGNMGSSAKFNYTVIGDSVNLGSRLESANKIYNTGILISEQTLRQAGDGFRYREVDLLVVKGRTAPVRIYELRGLRSDEPALAEMQFLESFAEALELYRNRKWREARELFQTIQQLHPGDAVTAIYLARSQQCEASPPGPDWDGVFRQPEE
jgi:adenylate cyclase